jgi:hypothetical protein
MYFLYATVAESHAFSLISGCCISSIPGAYAIKHELN